MWMWTTGRAAAPVGRATPPARRGGLLAPACLLLLLGTAPAVAQGRQDGAGPRGGEALQLHVYSLEHKDAMEALTLIQPLLSSQGTVELRPAENTLAIRDNLAALSAIVTALRRFDRPARPLEIQVMIIHAQRSSFSPRVQDDELPEPLLVRLKEMLPFSIFRVLARTDLRTREGESVTYELGSGFRISFSSGTLVNGRDLPVHDFRILRTRGEAAEPLIHSNLGLRLDAPMALSLAADESSSTALVVVLTPRLGGGGGSEER